MLPTSPTRAHLYVKENILTFNFMFRKTFEVCTSNIILIDLNKPDSILTAPTLENNPKCFLVPVRAQGSDLHDNIAFAYSV